MINSVNLELLVKREICWWRLEGWKVEGWKVWKVERLKGLEGWKVGRLEG